MVFGNLAAPTPDPLLTLIGRFRADSRPWKMDLGIGVYRDAHGDTPVFAAVKEAERSLVEKQATKSYRGNDGDPLFVRLLAKEALRFDDAAGLQTVGGTGALRLAADLLAGTRPGRRIWLGVPTWPNHIPLLTAAGLRIVPVETHGAAETGHRPEALLSALHEATPGDAVLLHACCHNPTGVDPAAGFWELAAEIIAARGLVPLVDAAYQGLGRGWDRDVAGVRFLAQSVPHALIAYSCDKNFGLYRERVGALFVAGTRTAQNDLLCGHLTALVRSNYSMPPDHGAAVVRCILEDAALTERWHAELADMRTRLQSLRASLASHGQIGAVDLRPLAHGSGMFALLPLSAAQIDLLTSEFGVYMAPSGRINIAGLAEGNIAAFAEALRDVQLRHAA